MTFISFQSLIKDYFYKKNTMNFFKLTLATISFVFLLSCRKEKPIDNTNTTNTEDVTTNTEDVTETFLCQISFSGDSPSSPHVTVNGIQRFFSGYGFEYTASTGDEITAGVGSNDPTIYDPSTGNVISSPNVRIEILLDGVLATSKSGKNVYLEYTIE